MGNFHATTIVAVKRADGDVCIGGDGQVTMGETAIMKHSAKKVRKIYKEIFSGLASVAVIEIVLYVIFYYAFFIQ